MKKIFLVDFISGVSLGIELHTGEDLEPGDAFAMTIDLFIIRVTFILSEGDRYDDI